VITRAAGHSRGVDAFDGIGDIALVIAAVVLGYRVYADAKRRTLWGVSRTLVLSYIFIGVIPALLIVAFFLVVVTLLFFNISSYMVRNRFSALVEDARYLVDNAALEMQHART